MSSRESVFNVGDPESYVSGNDKLAAQQGDFLMRQKLMQQNAAQFAAQLADNQQNRSLQKELTGTAADRFGYDTKLQMDRYGGDLALESQRGQNSMGIVNAQMGPANARLDMERTAYADQAPQRELAGGQAKYDLGRLKAKGTIDDYADNIVSQELRGGQATPSAGSPGSPLAGPIDPNARPAQATGMNQHMRERLLNSRLGLGTDPDQLFQRQIIEGMVQSQDPAVRQAGLKMLSSQGVDLPPEAISALSKNDNYGATEAERNPNIAFTLDQMASKAKRLATGFGNSPEAATEGIKTLFAETITQMVNAHIPADQAKVVILKKLNEVLPQAGSSLELILRDLLPPFGAISNDTERGTMARNAVGL